MERDRPVVKLIKWIIFVVMKGHDVVEKEQSSLCVIGVLICKLVRFEVAHMWQAWTTATIVLLYYFQRFSSLDLASSVL